jgi:hypothetical protein
MSVILMLCCNDPRGGLFQHWLGDATIEVRGESVELNGHRVRMAFKGGGKLRIGKVEVQPLSFAEWVGNWCWDSATLTDEDARQVVNYLIGHGWHCTSGPVEWYDRINGDRLSGDGGDITADEWQKLFAERPDG